MEPKAPEPLRDLIFQRIRDKGMITFEEFMDLALYHPRWGYYSSRGEIFGKAGDYITNPHVHPIFGTLLARQVFQMWDILGRPDPFVLVEMGAGSGLLSKDILVEFEGNRPELFEVLRLVIIEKIPYLVERQKELLEDYGASGKVVWEDWSDYHCPRKPFTGCFISNELVDSFPVHRVVWEEGRLKEIFVDVNNDQLVEKTGPCSTIELPEYLKWQGIRLVEGQRTEINLRARSWLQGIARRLLRGFIITIDYGYPAEEYYAPYRMDGTLLCHWRHRAIQNPYIRIGRQDITAHVNFSALIGWGRDVGLQPTGLVPQYRFFLSLGLLDELARLEEKKDEIISRGRVMEYYRQKWGMRYFLMPTASGLLFKVLVQHKGLEAPTLDGLVPPKVPA